MLRLLADCLGTSVVLLGHFSRRVDDTVRLSVFLIVESGTVNSIYSTVPNSFVLSVCLSVRPPARMEQLGSHWTDFHEIWCLSILYDNILLSASYSENVSDSRCRENQSTRDMFNNSRLPPPQIVSFMR